MVKFQWAGGSLWQRLKRWVDDELFICRITYWSLFYNSTTSWSTVVDAAMEPVFWSVDHIVRMMGPAFVVAVVCLTTSVVAIFYVCLLPHKYEKSVPWTIYHLVVGHWLLANIVFNYFKAAFTSPGHPPRDVPSVSSICKKCIAPKPPRAHHCSVCDSCVLKMDHHCPWLNNCVGHFNHRYFFLFCMYMWLGTVYVSLCAYPLFAEHFYGDQEMGVSGFFYPFIMAKDALTGASRPKIKKESSIGSVDVKEDPVRETPSPTRTTLGMYGHHFIMYEFMLCSAVSIALLLLLCWHARLVTRAETSIEVHTNQTEKKRLRKKGLVFRNPYNFGFKRNWKKFLGITHGRSFLYHVLLPSSHPPDEDGLVWNTTLQSAESELLNI